MESVLLDILPGHCRNLADGMVVHLKPSMIGSGMEVKLCKKTASRLRRAMKQGKGARLAMSPEEIEASGGRLTWRSFRRGLKRGWSFYKKYVRPVAGPIIEAGIKTAAKAAPAAAVALGQPELAALAPIAEEALLKIAKKTGATGRKMKGGAMKKKSAVKKRAVMPAMTPAIDIGSLESGRDLIHGSGLTLGDGFSGGGLTLGGSMGSTPRSWGSAGPAPFVDYQNPAMKPLIQIGNLQHGSYLIKST
jgi:hypothetical protein